MSDPTIGIVMAVDDEPANLELLARILTDHDRLRVHPVNDPRHALDTFRRVEPDVVLLDFNMPYLNGFEVMSQVQAAIPEGGFVPLLIMTANVDPGIRRQALAMGAHDFVTKPFDTTEVRLRVQNFLRTRRLHVQLERQKQTLEDRVDQRTRDLQRANQRLVVADRAKTDLLALVSHEMRTPLTVIRGFTELITRRWDQLPVGQRDMHVEAIGRNVSRLETMIGNLLLAAELETSDGTAPTMRDTAMAEAPLEPLIRRAIDESLLDPASVTIDCPLDATVEANARVLRPVLTNLLDNAHKYGQPPVEIHCAITDASIDIGVRDHGEGVPEEFIDRMFERFTQASVGDRRTATGSGLGLWIASRLADALGAELSYQAATPGALFRLRIPRRASGS